MATHGAGIGRLGVDHGVEPALDRGGDGLAGAAIELRERDHVEVAGDGIGLLKDILDHVAQVVRDEERAALEGVGHLGDNLGPFERELERERAGRDVAWGFDLEVTSDGCRDGAGAYARDERVAQADEFAYDAAGVAAGVAHDVVELGQAVEGEFIVPVFDGLDEVLDVFDDLVADVVELLGELAVTQLSGDFVHPRTPFKTSSKG